MTRPTGRFGFPLRPLFADELPPVHVPPSRPQQCRHGMSSPWLKRCEAEGAWRFPDGMADNSSQSERDWVEGARWCTEHAPPGAVPVEGDES